MAAFRQLSAGSNMSLPEYTGLISASWPRILRLSTFSRSIGYGQVKAASVLRGTDRYWTKNSSRLAGLSRDGRNAHATAIAAAVTWPSRQGRMRKGSRFPACYLEFKVTESQSPGISHTVSISRKLAGIYEIGAGPNRIQSMEGIRGFAVLLVFCVHYHAIFGRLLPPGFVPYAISNFAGQIGHSGVDLFLVLSGYVIYDMLLRKPVGYWSFCRRRVQRIYPTFLSVFTIYVLYDLIVAPRPEIPAEPVAAVVYLIQNAALLPGVFDIRPLVAVSWSLSYEIFFYLTLPLLVTGGRMRTWTTGARCAFFLVAALLYAGLHLTCTHCEIPSLRLSPAAHLRMCMFVVGILVFEAQHSFLKDRLNPAGELASLGALLAGFVLYYLVRTDTWMVAHLRTSLWAVGVLSFSFFGFVLYCFAFPGFLRRAFSWAPLRWLGNMSYSYYLVHGLALHGLSWLVTRFAPTTGGDSFSGWAGAGSGAGHRGCCNLALCFCREAPLVKGTLCKASRLNGFGNPDVIGPA